MPCDAGMSRILPAGFVWPWLPTRTGRPPSGDLWVHEIKNDSVRVIARKDGDRVRLYSRPGDDLTNRFPLVADAEARLRSQSCIVGRRCAATRPIWHLGR